MIKTLSKAQKMEREKFRIPRSVQDAIPIRRIFADGIFQVGNQYSKTWSFTDINYAIASKEDKTSMFLDYSELLNALDSGASAKITIYNRRINKAEFERSVLLPDKDDGLDEYRHEFNQMLTAQVTGTSNSIVRERYLTVSVVKRNPDEARSYFARVGTDLVTHLAQLSSVANELTLTERLHIFRDFFKAGEQAAAEFNIHEHAKRGRHFKDWFCPDSMEFAADHFKIDARYGRVLYLQDYASYIKDSFVSELCDLDRDLMLSIDILPVPTDEAARQLQSTLLGVETNVANWQRRQNANNNFTATIPYDMELQRKETKEMLDDLTTRDQRMMFGLVTLVHLADNKEQLDSDTETLYSTARKHLCQLSTLRWQQKDGLDTVLPYGLRKIQALRTLTTESTAVLIPFRAQEIMEPNGLYYGQNAVSKNMIVADRRLLLNGNSFRLGVSGSGKSMSAKEEIVQIALSTEDDILILDPESEFGYLTEALGGEVIRISATSDTHINALDMDRAIYADGIFQVGNQYSKTWSFTDINYAIASKEDKTSMFLDYSELLNALDSGASAKITIYNRRINKAEFECSVLLPDKDDGLDEYRHEFNQMLTAQVTGTSNSIVRERYLTVSVVKRNADEARSYFARVGTDLVTHLAQLSSVTTELTLNERLHIFRDFFKAGEQAAAEFNIHEHAFQAGCPLWSGAVFAGLRQLHQGQLCVGTLRP